MERYDLGILTKKIYDSDISFFTIKTIRDILEIKKESTFFAIMNRLVESELFIKIEKGKYLLSNNNISDFTLANLIYQPSYISFEAALSFYGILSQFPYEISSASVKKTIRKVFEGKIFTYNHIKKDLFWGYEKKNNELIALPEKALLDQLYIAANGYKRIDLDEYDLDRINIVRLREYLSKYPKTRQFNSIIGKARSYVKL
ncbi:MAG: hypothetical protein P9L98_05565 [Candidatus Kaelpia imicola]|nr:hypothetical protein [Candidatus Kaelpia imicola]